MIGRTLDHYQITEKLGEGGMGVVYKALDRHLDRFVALKVLPPAQVADVDRKRRFVKEAKSASALNHPGIINIYDIAESDGIDFIVMEFIAGQTLAQLIRGRALDPQLALLYAVQVAEALAKAHEAGIIHRDLKPDNVMITADGRAKILDFGLAKLTEPAGPGESAVTRTEAGTLLGTVAYMSPEQAQGSEVDTRSDIFSFGSLLYEMFTGRRAFAGSSYASVISKILRDEPPPASIPAPIENLIGGCLRKSPAQRFQSMKEVKDALDQREAAPKTPPHSIAVLPFLDMSPARDQEYFCEGISEEIINALTKLKGLQVASRTSAFRFKGAGHDIQDIGRRLNVGAVLEGSVRKAGDRLRVTAQLIDVADGYHLWSERYDRGMEDVFAIQDEIAAAIVDTLKVKLGVGEVAGVKRYTDNVEAYSLYLKGRYFFAKRPGDVVYRAIECFEGAIKLDPDLAPAYSGLADAYSSLGAWEGGVLAPIEAFSKSKAAAAKAIQLDDSLAEAHTSMGYVAMHFDWQWELTEAQLRRSIQLNPSYGVAHHWYSHFLVSQGRMAESLAESKRAIEVDPMDLILNIHMAWHYWMAHQPDHAVEHCRRVLHMEPAYGWAYFYLGLTLEQQPDLDQAVEEFRKAVSFTGGNLVMRSALGHAYAAAGERRAAIEILEDLKHLAEEKRVLFYEAALIHAALGETDEAFEWLDKAYRERSTWLSYLAVEPRLDPLRSDARFTALLKKVGLKPVVITA